MESIVSASSRDLGLRNQKFWCSRQNRRVLIYEKQADFFCFLNSWHNLFPKAVVALVLATEG